VPQNIRRLLPVLALTVFSSNLGNGIIAPLLPIYAKELGASGVWLGIIFAGTSIASALLMPFTGRLSDRRGRKLFLAFGIGGLTLTSFAYVWAHSVAALTIVRFVQGAAAAMVMPIAQAYIGDITPQGEEGKWMGIFNATFIIGFGTGPLLGGVVADHFGMNTAFYIMGFFNLVAFLSTLFFLPEILQRRQSSGRFSLKVITASNITRSIFTYQIGASSIRGIMTTFIPVFAVSMAGLNSSLIGTILTVSIIANSLLQVPFGNLSDKMNRRLMIVVGALGSGISMVLVPSANGFWMLLMFLGFGALFDGISTPAAMAAIIQDGRKYGMGVATSVSNMGAGLGMGLAPILAGFIVDIYDVSSAFYVAAVISIISVGIFSVLTRRSQVPRL
jgi:DHA1 family multidrug resistance protein-like MFS transporter